MASLRKKKNSPFWIVRYKSPNDGTWKDRSTEFRHASKHDTQKAEKLRDDLTARELKIKETPTGNEWHRWVPAFLSTQANHTKTALRYENAWSALSTFFKEQNVTRPGALERKHAYEYMDWRTTTPLKRSKPASKNTAILEIKTLRKIVKEAVIRGYIANNPLTELGIKKEKATGKEELTDEDIERIRAELNAPSNGGLRREWMINAFEIAIHQGVRLRETDIPLRNVDLDSDPPLIHFAVTKGDKPFTAPLHPNLVPLFRKWKAEGRRTAVGFPKSGSKYWYKLFKRLKLENKSFHSTRVTVASRLAKADVPISEAMQYINHSSEVVHRAYQRWRPGDLKHVHAALRIPRAGSSESPDAPPATPESDAA